MKLNIYLVIHNFGPRDGRGRARVRMRENGWRTRRGAERRVAKLRRQGIDCHVARYDLLGDKPPEDLP